MLKLWTVYPYDLNGRLGNDYKKSNTHVLVGNKSPSPTRNHYQISCGTSRKNDNSLAPDEFLIKLKHHLNLTLSDVFNFSRVSLLAMNKFSFKNTANVLQDNLNHTSNSIYPQRYFMALDIIKSKISKHRYLKLKQKHHKMSILNKGEQLNNMPRTFHDPSKNAYLPIDIKLDDPTFAYSLNDPMRSKILLTLYSQSRC